MIITASNVNFTQGITIIDDINSLNSDKVFDAIDNCKLYITEKFPMPRPNDTIIKRKSDTIQKLNSLLSEESNKITKGVSREFSTESQLNNFRAKVMSWCAGLFSGVIQSIDEGDTHVNVVIQNDLSKHEWLFIRWLYGIGVNFLIISSNASYIVVERDIVNIITYGTNENLKYTKSNELMVCEYKSLDDIEKALYDDNKVVKVIVSGMTSYIDTCNFYAKLNNKCEGSNEWLLVNNKFTPPTFNESNSIPRLIRDKTDYIVCTVLQFLKPSNLTNIELLKENIKNYVVNNNDSSMTGQILYNKLVYLVCILNRLLLNSVTHIVYYGKANKNDTIVLDILGLIPEISVVVACSDKNSTPALSTIQLFELQDSLDIFDIPTIDKRDNACTLASKAQDKVNETLFSGDTLGMYKPGQFRTCKSIHFSTTYDEIKMWWNKELYLRPKFEASGITAIVPNMFKIIKGWNTSEFEYIEEVQKYCCGKTLLCKDIAELKNLVGCPSMSIRNGTDINKTQYNFQKPFFESNKLVRERIKTGKNYTYSFLDLNKQDIILDKIEEILTGDYINKSMFNSNQDFIDTVLNITLNLGLDILKYIQWFEFYTYNPNLVLVLKDQTLPDIKDFILLVFLQLIGFDILIFVPTRYTTIENFTGSKFIYETHDIGEACYDIETTRLHVSNNIEIPNEHEDSNSKKKGFFSKLFGL